MKSKAARSGLSHFPPQFPPQFLSPAPAVAPPMTDSNLVTLEAK